MSLVTLDDTKNRLGISLADPQYDVYLTSEIALFSDTIEKYCNRLFNLSTYTETFYRQDFNGDDNYVLYHFPVDVVTTVTEKAPDCPDVARDSRVNNRTGMLSLTVDGIRKSLFQNTGNSGYIEVDYDAGFADIPLDIQECVFSLIEGRFNKMQAGVALNFGNNVQRISIPGVMGIDFDYTLSSNDRKTKYGMILGDWQNVLDNYVSERTVTGETSIKYWS